MRTAIEAKTRDEKIPVIGAVERGGSVAAKATRKGKLKGRHLRAFVKDRVDTRRASLITDEYKGYLGMVKVLPHAVIKHAQWYVDGTIHTNTIGVTCSTAWVSRPWMSIRCTGVTSPTRREAITTTCRGHRSQADSPI